MSKILLFTDLDGTLLDEETYSSDLSLPALRKLQAWNVSIVFCSSKTRSEQEMLQQVLDVKDPFIVENGSAIIVPSYTINPTSNWVEKSDATQVFILGMPVEEVRKTLKQVVAKTGITYQSFSGLSNEQVAQIAGLDLEAAKRAKNREFSETVVTQFSTQKLQAFIHECELNGLNCTVGGRYLSVIGQGADKGKAVRALTEHYRSSHERLVTIGIGDSLNDAPMLRAVNIPYLVQRPDGQFKSLGVENLNYLEAIGPLGFTKMVDDIKRRWLNLD